ncbi:MAG: PrsW family intramembrane metalloprotease [bacterium]|nr:PrsW family intramembrane metalloprotease [bacterium]
MITTDPKILGLAFLGGIIPSLLWLWFWLKQEETRPEPKGVLTVVFIMGMIGVILVLPIQKYIQSHVSGHEWQLIGWAAAEEIIKYLAVLVILYKTTYTDEPLDWPIYCITAALGFAALENTFFLIKPLSLGETTVSLLTGQLRFLGSTLLHTISSGIVGISIGLSFFMDKFNKKVYVFCGLIFAIALHSVFNFFIMKNDGSDFLKVFAFLWVTTIIIMLLFEKIRRMSGE